MLNRQKGSILIEGLVAILIFSVGVLALMGMQSVSIKNASQAKYRNDAALLANRMLSQIMVDQANIANYDDAGAGSPTKEAWLADVVEAIPNGTATIAYVDTPTMPRQVTITLTWRAPDEPEGSEHRHITSANIMPAEN